VKKLKEYLKLHKDGEIYPSDIANILREIEDEEEFKEAIKLVPKSIVGYVALELPDRYFDDIVNALSVDDLVEAIEELESDDQVEFIQKLEKIDSKEANEVFKKLDKQDQRDIEKLLSYEEHEAGAYMQTEVFTAKENEVVKDAIERFSRLKKEGKIENVHTVFIVNEENRLLYGIDLDDILTFDFNKTFAENIKESKEHFEPIRAYDKEDISNVVEYFKKYDLSAIPIVNSRGILVGRITSDDIYDIINEQATEQMYNLAGVDDEAEEEEDVIKATKTRANWLAINLFTAIVASLVIGIFQDTINSMVALAVLMPIVASMGGNAGTQTLTVVVRQLALGDISQSDAKRIIKKEVAISLLNGFLFAIIMGVIAYIWFDKGMLGVVIGLSMIINLFMAGFFGSVIPLFLKRMGVDPAIGSTVVLTTVTDVVGFFSFLGLASLILL
jgi:magnesium transporter